MRYDITNIPIAEVFEEGDGCPICRLRNTLENIGFTVRERTAEKVHYTFNGNLLNRDIVELA